MKLLIIIPMLEKNSNLYYIVSEMYEITYCYDRGVMIKNDFNGNHQ